ncbi:MAG: tail fiber protein [Gammaproteobacteria bacterium]
MANYEATRYNFDGGDLTGIEGIPTATIIPWSDTSVPTGYLECDGAAVSRTTYAALYAIVGDTYGSGDGSTTFNVPDLQDNIPMGKSGTKAVGSTGGANTVTPTGNVAGSTANATLSTAQLASHNHSSGANTMGRTLGHPETGFNVAVGSSTGAAGSGGGHAHNMSANFAGDANSVVQPYLTLMYIIKT